MHSFAKWLLLIVSILIFMRKALAVCPTGFVEQGNMCVQLPPTCPANYVLYNGLCYPANQVPSTPVVQPQAPTQPCNSQPPVSVSPPCGTSTEPCAVSAQPCNVVTTTQPCNVVPPGNVVAATPPCNTSPPCNIVTPVQPCSAVTPVQPCAAQPCNSVLPAQPCNNVAPAQPCTAIPPTQPCAAQPCNAIPPTQPCNIAAPVQPCNAVPPAQPCNIVAPAQPCNVSPPPAQPCTTPPPTVVYPIYPTYPTSPPPQTTTSTPIVVPTTTYRPEPLNTTTTTTTTTPLPPPEALTQCPEGTINVKGVCRLIYCHKGIFKDNTCIQTICPEGTIWTGNRCATPEPIQHSITYNHTFYTTFNHTEPDVIINNVNNMVVNASITIPLPTSSNCDGGHCDDAPIPPSPSPLQPELPPPHVTNQPKPESPTTVSPCCNVMTPRVCKQNANDERWNCYSKRYRQCGEMCVAPTIYLKPPRVHQPQPRVVVMPPNPTFQSCHTQSSCQHTSKMYDCSSCASGIAEGCAPYCYNYNCGHKRCQFYDQRDYCSMSNGYGNNVGCTMPDGCYDDWCGDY